MQTEFSMSEAKRQSQAALETLHRAHSRLLRKKLNLNALDNRIAFFKLMGSVVLLAVLVGMFPKIDPALQFVSVLAFILVFLAISHMQKAFQRKVHFWENYASSLALTQARMQRRFEEMSARAAPWHQNIAASVPLGHVYAHDLDVSTTFFSLLDTCTTPEGSQKLFDELMEAGLNSSDSAARELRVSRAKALSRRTQILRKMEALRLNENYIADYLQHESGTSQSGSAALSPEMSVAAKTSGTESGDNDVLNELSTGEAFKINTLRYGFAVVSVAAWAVLLIPALMRFFRAPDWGILINSLSIYALFPIAGIFVFAPIVSLASRTRRRVRTLLEILAHMKQLSKVKGFAEFSSSKENALKEISSLNKAVDLVELRGNPVLWLALHLIIPFDALVCVFITYKLSKSAPRLKQWWQDAIEFDLVCAFSRLARENPTFQFIQSHKLTNDDEILATDLGHPCLPAETRVCNSFSFRKSAPLILLTGSNMAGKSTFLRTLGLNTLLLNMGAPVCAARFVSSPHRILCAIRVDDSLSEGMSYFYAEVRRLKLILENLRHSADTPMPSLFLIDEIFRGTNNRERFYGSWHLLRALLNASTFGLVSTHDLALTDLQKKDSRLLNMHFREHVEEGKLIFDYQLKDGPCPTTNALHIMRAEGLPIPPDSELDDVK